MASRSHDQVIAQWVERDLTAAARAGELPPAYEVEPALEQVQTLLEAGRHPVLAGEPGVGKTAALYELVRRSVAGEGPPQLAQRRVLQFSLRQRASALRNANQMHPETQALVEALLHAGDDVVPFFRDLHLAYRYDLEAQFESLGTRFGGPLLAEGERGLLAAMFENSPELGERYTLVELEEPAPETALRIVTRWAEAATLEQGRRFSQEALEEALQLTHRFLPRQRLPRKLLELLQQALALAPQGAIGAEQVIERFCRAQRVPRFLVDPALPLDLAATEAHFALRVLGQPEAVSAVVRMIALIKAGLSDVRRPFGSFLFVGPTGVGKTHIAQLLAEFLFGSRERMVRLNMADFQGEGDPQGLFGNPGAWALSHKRGLLTARLMGQPFAVLLLDEFEKAHEKVHDRFLQLMDEGCFINGAGETVSCRATILIATSNTGAELFRGRSLGLVEPADAGELDREVDRRLMQRFRFEFLNRFDQVVHFHPLTREDIRTIARRELLQVASRPGLLRRELKLEVDESVIDWLALNGYDPYYGARVLRRTIERHVTTALAEALVGGGVRPGATLALTVRRNRPAVRLLDAPAEPRRERVELPHGATKRTLDARGLRAEAEALLEAAGARLRALDARRQERSALLEALNQASAWDQPGSDGYLQLGRFRELDVLLRAEERLAAPLTRLQALLHNPGPAPEAAQLGRPLEEAARAFGEWQARLAEEGPSGVWLVLSDLDPLKPAGDWVAALVEMELQWTRGLQLLSSVAAYDRRLSPPALVVLDVDGPGAAALLALEQGAHRLARGKRDAQRARVDVVPKRAAEPGGVRAAALRKRQGLFGLTLQAQARLALVARGRTLELVGEDPRLLRRLLADLGAAWSGPVEAEELARVYGEDGAGARDPRTGAVVARLKDALKGRLEPLLEAWRRRV